MPAVGDVLAGRYRVDARLGAGGMATVWRARDLRLERDVAVKILLPNLAGDPALAARFDREARILAAVGDPHVVGIHDVVEAGPGTEPFLVMELCPDGSLGDRLADRSALPAATALPILADAAAGLAALHARGIVHRDVTPRNILLAGRSARLGDLGLARPEDAVTTPGGGLTATGTAVGTLGYLAPEILAGRPATTASDVYGLAAVAYRALAGNLPHPAASIAELVAARELPVAPLGDRVPGLPVAVASAVTRALDVDPARRPTAAELARTFATPESPFAATPGPSPADERTALDVRRGTPSSPRQSEAVSPSFSPGKLRRGRARRPLPDAGPGYHGPGLWSGEVIAIIVVAVVIILAVILLGGRPG
jgi:serine/threonine-protein kinase